MESIQKGLKKIKDNPQLVYTIFVALLIIAAFIFMANMFIGIATDAEERLINVRIGSIQDSFVSFAGDYLDQPDYLDQKIKDIVNDNQTIEDFRVIEKSESATSSSPYVTIASSGQNVIATSSDEDQFLYSLAVSQPANSLTITDESNGQRIFRTTRAITDTSGNVTAVVVSTQTLSEADMQIENNIQRSIIILIAVLIVIMLLFLRHSRIIDYMSLYKKLKEVDQLKDDFLSMASHELRTPLTVIRGYSEFIREAPELSPKTLDFAQKIDMSAKDLDSLVADMLDVSRIEQGRMTFKLEIDNPKAIVDEVSASLRVTVEAKGLKLTTTDETKPEQKISADKVRLKQILVNVIGNSVKYTLKGEVSVHQYIEKGRLFIRVDDTGIGMSAEDQKNLFQKFYRIRNKDTESIMGTGLGLWITKSMVEQMNGSLTVESIQGVGSHFLISFPLVT